VNILQNIKNPAPMPEINFLLQVLGKFSNDFRDLINNEKRLNYDLRQNDVDFNKFCSAMDIVDDILMAMFSYIEHQNDDKGLAYIYMFGLLESFYLQQNAIIALGLITYALCGQKKFNLCTEYPEVEKVREIRNCIASHPISNTDNHFINRHSITLESFDYMVINELNEMEFKTANLQNLIKIQAKSLSKALSDFINLLTKREQNHRDKFKDQKLFDIFKYCDFAIQRLPTDRSHVLIGSTSVHLKILEGAIQEFIGKLNTRHPVYTESAFFKHEMIHLERAIERLKAYFDSEPSTTNEDAWIWIDYIQKTIDKLKEWAKEIDNEYSGIKEEQKPQPTGPVTITINGVDFF
jgi:hypothetical protein